MPKLHRALRPDDKCMLAVFSRDLAFAGQSEQTGRSFPWIEPEFLPDRSWNVIGIYDYLKFNEPGPLNGISPRSTHAASNHRSPLVIFPFQNEDLIPPDEVYPLLTLAADASTVERHPWVIFGAVHVSAVVHESEGVTRDGETLRSLERFIRLWQQIEGPEHQTYFFGCLSSPDLVLISFPQNPRELRELYRSYRSAQCITVAELRSGELHRPIPDADVPRPEEPGHGCMSVQPFFAFHGGPTPTVDRSDFWNDERQAGIQYRFRLRVRCGHEDQVAAELSEGFSDQHVKNERMSLFNRDIAAERGVSDTRFDFTWDQHMIRGYFSHFSDFKRIWSELWFNKRWRSLHLLNSHSAIVFPNDAIAVPSWNHSRLAWKIEDSVYDELVDMHERIDRFSSEFLNPTQRAEMLTILGSYYACFFRQDLIGAARDLFPFFQQLSHALGAVDAWREYLESTTHEDTTRRRRIFDNDMRDLFVQVGRAIRNRIEHRTTVSDPPFPQTFREGTSKTIGAYSVIVYLCWELFRRTTDDPEIRASDAARDFAGCVHSGTDGRVICLEFFRDFRRFLLSREERQGSPADGHPWRAKLLAFDFSGHSLLLPEYFIAHSLHEVAELADWLASPGNATAREIINKSGRKLAHAILKKELARFLLGYGRLTVLSTSEQEAVREKSRELASFSKNFMDLAVAASVKPSDWLATATYQDLVDVSKDLLTKIPPLEYLKLYHEAMKLARDRRSYLTDFRHVCGPRVPRPPQAEAIYEFLDTTDLFPALVSLQEHLSEVLADAGMWCGLYNLLTRSHRDNLTTCCMAEEDRRTHVNKLFWSVLQQCDDFGAGEVQHVRLYKSVVARWQAHYAAVSQPDTDWYSQFISAYEEAAGRFSTLQSQRDRILHGLADGQESALRWITDPLRQLVPYGGRREIQLGRLPTQQDEFILSIFDRLWNGEPSTSGRIDLILRLWATSMHFAIPKLIAPRANAMNDEEAP
ncbi:MAG: hypothetical protein R6X25_15250 [Candidatus Krumholzibacteriia bacterium]